MEGFQILLPPLSNYFQISVVSNLYNGLNKIVSETSMLCFFEFYDSNIALKSLQNR